MPRGPKPLKSRLKQNDFYCVSCRRRVSCDPEDIRFKRFRNKKVKGGVPALKCKCEKCDTNVTKFVKRKDAAALQKKFK